MGGTEKSGEDGMDDACARPLTAGVGAFTTTASTLSTIIAGVLLDDADGVVIAEELRTMTSEGCTCEWDASGELDVCRVGADGSGDVVPVTGADVLNREETKEPTGVLSE